MRRDFDEGGGVVVMRRAPFLWPGRHGPPPVGAGGRGGSGTGSERAERKFESCAAKGAMRRQPNSSFRAAAAAAACGCQVTNPAARAWAV